MPMPFFSDTETTPHAEHCGAQIGMFDGPAVCTRLRGHEKVSAKLDPSAQLHQENYEGWVWNNNSKAAW